MASTVFFVNQKGDEVVSRHYRNDVSKAALDAFRNRVIKGKMTGTVPSVTQLEGTSFLYIRHKNLYLVAATKGNPNPALILEYLFQKLRILKAYFGEDFTDDEIKSNFTLVYELFDETMDFGYPQNCSVDVLKLYINQAESLYDNSSSGSSGTALTSQITGAIDWRRDGIRYRSNEVYIFVQEALTMLFNNTGAILHSEITGKVMMKALLSGMPECKFGLNDKLIMEKEGGAAAAATNNKGHGVTIDDCTFHRCVRLGKFDTERTITFIPPDGEFELMRYRVAAPSQPFKLLPNIIEEGKSRLLVNLDIKADFPSDKRADSMVVKIPMPPNTATAKLTVDRGRVKYEPGQGALVWRIGSLQGGSECKLHGSVELLQVTREKAWLKAPITCDFQIPMYSASGVQVRFLKVYEKSSYQTKRWVKYITKNGDYQMRF